MHDPHLEPTGTRFPWMVNNAVVKQGLSAHTRSEWLQCSHTCDCFIHADINACVPKCYTLSAKRPVGIRTERRLASNRRVSWINQICCVAGTITKQSGENTSFINMFILWAPPD